MRKKKCHDLIAGLGCLLLSGAASAELIGGVEFPEGEISFADVVIQYTQGYGGVTAANAEASNALGVPDYVSGGACSGTPSDCPFVSLGVGGSLILQFTDNLLTGSDDDGLDLWIFEVGPDVEDTLVDVSTDGINWNPVGSVFGSTSGIDLDAYGFGSGSMFSYVRLTDVITEGATSGASVGADIDAVGAISTVAVQVSEPGTLALMLLGFAGLAGMRRRQAG